MHIDAIQQVLKYLRCTNHDIKLTTMKLKGYYKAIALIALLHLVKGNKDNLKTTDSEQQRMRAINAAAKVKEIQATSFSTLSVSLKMCAENELKCLSRTQKPRRQRRENIKNCGKSCRKNYVKRREI